MSDFKANMHQILFPLGLCPRPHWGSLQRSPDPLAVFKGAYGEREGEGEREDEGRGKGGGICRTNVKLLPTRLEQPRQNIL